MDQKLRAILRREQRLKLATVFIILATCITVLLAVNNMLISVVIAFVLKYLMAPVIDVLERRKVPRQVAILVPFFACAGLIGFGFYKVLPLISGQIANLEAKLPRYQVDLVMLVSTMETRFKGFFKLYDINFSHTVNTWILSKTTQISAVLPSAISSSLTVLLLAPLFAYFMLQDGKRISRSILSLVPNNLFELALNLSHQLNEQIGGFIRARFLEAAIVGFVVWLGLQICGFPYASLLGLFAAATNLIPYIGPIIGAVPAVLIALLSEDSLMTNSVSLNLVIVSSIFFLAQLIDVLFVIPLVVARIVNLHPVTVIIVIIIGAQIMGILGMVISIPVASAIKLVFSAVYDHLMELRA
jgi:putative permease